MDSLVLVKNAIVDLLNNCFKIYAYDSSAKRLILNNYYFVLLFFRSSLQN